MGCLYKVLNLNVTSLLFCFAECNRSLLHSRCCVMFNVKSMCPYKRTSEYKTCTDLNEFLTPPESTVHV